MDIQQKRTLGGRLRTLALVGSLLAVVLLQFAYDRVKPPAVSSSGGGGFSPAAIRMADLGFHSTVASFMWIATMPELIDLFFNGRTEYISDREFLNQVDPKLSYPYAFTVLALPIVKQYPGRVTDALLAGQEGLANADPDWRIPYYMAIDYYLENKDSVNAAKYFDIAARTPGVPDFAQRFALNFGVVQRDRDRVIGIWETVRDSTNDPDTKARAEAYVERLQAFDAIDAASKAYKQRFGEYPATVDDLVAKGFLPEMPQDPFGFTFTIQKDGTAGIDLTKLPAYMQGQSQ